MGIVNTCCELEARSGGSLGALRAELRFRALSRAIDRVDFRSTVRWVGRVRQLPTEHTRYIRGCGLTGQSQVHLHSTYMTRVSVPGLHHQNRARARAAHLQRPSERAAAPRSPTHLILCTDDERSQEDVKPGRWSRVGALTQGGVTEVAGRDRRERASVRRRGSGSRHATHLDSGNDHRGHVEQPSCGCKADKRSATPARMHVKDARGRRCDKSGCQRLDHGLIDAVVNDLRPSLNCTCIGRDSAMCSECYRGAVAVCDE